MDRKDFYSCGTQQWIKQTGTDEDDHAFGVAVDSSGNPYVTGDTEGAFSGFTNADAWRDIFLLKYDTDGNLQ